MDRPVPATLYDGQSARRFAVELDWDEAGLILRGESDGIDTVPFASLDLVDRTPEGLVFARADRAGWRLRLAYDSPPDLLARLPQGARYGRLIDRVGLGRAVIGLALASALVIALVMTAPSWLGPRVPASWERRIGDAMIGDIDPYTCHTPASDAALKRLVASVDPGQPKVRVELAKTDMINAVALPGGRVLVFDGLIQQATSPDELAGVIGHEIGHVRKRHVMQALLRQFGLSIMLSGSNSNIGGTLGGLAAMSYSREAEAEADAFSREQMAAADISPAPTAAFFARLRKGEGEGGDKAMTWLDSHPDTASRQKAFAAAQIKNHAYRPVLGPDEFAALRNACRIDRKARKWSLF